jgi:hypothetical protein
MKNSMPGINEKAGTNIVPKSFYTPTIGAPSLIYDKLLKVFMAMTHLWLWHGNCYKCMQSIYFLTRRGRDK